MKNRLYKISYIIFGLAGVSIGLCVISMILFVIWAILDACSYITDILLKTMLISLCVGLGFIVIGSLIDKLAGNLKYRRLKKCKNLTDDESVRLTYGVSIILLKIVNVMIILLGLSIIILYLYTGKLYIINGILFVIEISLKMILRYISRVTKFNGGYCINCGNTYNIKISSFDDTVRYRCDNCNTSGVINGHQYLMYKKW